MSYGKTNTAYSDQKNWSNTYLTDPRLLELLGPFDTDPCVHTEMPWRTAETMYNINDDGLAQEWNGRVFMNPPYRGVMKWAHKFVNAESGICLLNGRSTETKATQLIMEASDCIWFPSGRLTFYRPDGSSYDQKWFSSVLIGLHVRDRVGFDRAQNVYGGQVFYK